MKGSLARADKYDQRIDYLIEIIAILPYFK